MKTYKSFKKVDETDMYYLAIPKHGTADFLSAGRFVSKEGHIHPKRKLESAVLLVGYSGVCPIAQDGREYNLSKGTAMLLFPNTDHYGIGKTSGGQSHFWCHLRLPEGCRVLDYEPTSEDVIAIPEFSTLSEFGKFCVLFPQLIDAAENSESELRGEICSSYLKILLCELSENLRKSPDTKRSSAVTAAKATEWVRLHAKEGITPRLAAEALGYSGDYLSALLRRETGKNLGALITEAKVREAERLLLNSDMKISEIAYESGFSDAKYFMRCFSRLRGMTAGEFRRAHFREHRN